MAESSIWRRLLNPALPVERTGTHQKAVDLESDRAMPATTPVAPAAVVASPSPDAEAAVHAPEPETPGPVCMGRRHAGPRPPIHDVVTTTPRIGDVITLTGTVLAAIGLGAVGLSTGQWFRDSTDTDWQLVGTVTDGSGIRVVIQNRRGDAYAAPIEEWATACGDQLVEFEPVAAALIGAGRDDQEQEVVHG